MSDLRFGTDIPSNIYLETTGITAMYFGSTLVWPLVSPSPTMSPSITPSITITPSLSITPSRTPSVSVSATEWYYNIDYYHCVGPTCGTFIETAAIRSTAFLTVGDYHYAIHNAENCVAYVASVASFNTNPSDIQGSGAGSCDIICAQINPTPTPTPSISVSITPSVTPSLSVSLSRTPTRSVSSSLSVTPTASINEWYYAVDYYHCVGGVCAGLFDTQAIKSLATLTVGAYYRANHNAEICTAYISAVTGFTSNPSDISGAGIGTCDEMCGQIQPSPTPTPSITPPSRTPTVTPSRTQPSRTPTITPSRTQPSRTPTRTLTPSRTPTRPSDRRLKKNIKLVDNINGINIYQFRYKKSMNIPGVYAGVIAQELLGTIFENAVILVDNYYQVNYDLLGIEMKRIK